MQRSFLHFYLAISHELLAQSMQNLSQAKLANLDDAKQHLEFALSTLNDVRSQTGSSTGSHGGSASGSASTPDPTSSPHTPKSTPKGKTKPMSHLNLHQLKFIGKTDLRHRQQTEETTFAEHKSPEDYLFNLSPSRWLAGSSPQKTVLPATPKRQITKSKTPSPSVRLGFPAIVSNMRCNGLAGELTELVNGHIAWINTTISNIVQAHQRRIDISSPIEEVDKEEEGMRRMELIKSRRAAGWKRERFDAKKIQALCKVALEEL